MSVDLSGLKVGTAWRVRTSRGDGTLFALNTKFPQFVVQYDHADTYDAYQPSGLSNGGEFRIEQILCQLKAPADITAADLDGRVIETSDGGKVLFADGHAVVWHQGTISGWTWPDKWPDWWTQDGEIWNTIKTPEEYLADYHRELERRKNPPLVIEWQGECSAKSDEPWFGWCDVSGDIWHFYLNSGGSYDLFKNRRFVTNHIDFDYIEQYIRDHYASTK